jgi:hypothetical protein
MNIQTKASYKKELLAYFRTKRVLAIALVILGMSLFSPLLITGMGALMDAMGDLYQEFGMDISELTEALGTAASIGVSSSVSDITGIGLIVTLILLNRAAGGEQKKRAVIIPRSAGLRSFAYITPKFFVFAVLAMLASWPVSVLLFEVNDVTFSGVLLAGVLSGVCLMFFICFHLTLGTATGKAGMSAAVCITASLLLSNIFAFTISDYMYNPFALDLLAISVVQNGEIIVAELVDIAVTVVFALAIMVAAYYIALFAQNARKIDNSGNEIEL